MNRFIKYCGITFLLFFAACKEERCASAETAVQKDWHLKTTSTRFFPAKGLWLHRTNHPAKFSKYADAYAGFEMDVNIDTVKMLLDVYHPPETSLNIRVENFLNQKAAAGKYFWFDCKNLSLSNVAKTLTVLQQLDSSYQIKNRLVFESTNAAALKIIAAAGYYTFYYLSFNEETDLCTDTVLLSRIAAQIDTSFTAISADGRYIKTLHTLFPHCRKATWTLSTLRNWFQNEQQEMLQDSMVLIVLKRER